MAEPVSDQPTTHPEEIRGDFDLSIGKNIRLTGHGRLTPAGIVTMGIVAVGILLSAAAVVRAARR
jgi:hypothetical protein